MKAVEVTLLAKPGCHLCDDARQVILAAQESLQARGIVADLRELNILDDPELARKHAEDIPVVLVNGRQHAIWRVREDRLVAAVEKAAKPRFFR